MQRFPLISIVTPSFNQGGFIRETLQSLVDQAYPNLEVIIQDGGSTDRSVEIAQEYCARYPRVFKLFVEKDAGQADALNRGFARTQGEIMGFLNSDDTLFPGCLQRVAAEISPRRRRYLVFGRCLFTGSGERYVGIEHPAEYKSHFEFLAIWKRGYNTIPQPSVFWHRAVWQKCGGLNTDEHHVLDYDLFCRFSRHYRFHRVDELWSTFRMHSDSKSSQRSEAEVLAMSVKASRRYWGTWLSPLRWRLEVSYWMHSQQTLERARHYARRCEEAVAHRRYLHAFLQFLRTAIYSPRMARERLLFAWLVSSRNGLVQRFVRTTDDFTGKYNDHWVGPLFRESVKIPSDATKLILVLQHHPHGAHKTIKIDLRLNRKLVARHETKVAGQFAMVADLTPFRGQHCGLELRGAPFFVPRQLHGTPDDRRLVVQLLDLRIETQE